MPPFSTPIRPTCVHYFSCVVFSTTVLRCLVLHTRVCINLLSIYSTVLWYIDRSYTMTNICLERYFYLSTGDGKKRRFTWTLYVTSPTQLPHIVFPSCSCGEFHKVIPAIFKQYFIHYSVLIDERHVAPYKVITFKIENIKSILLVIQRDVCWY